MTWTLNREENACPGSAIRIIVTSLLALQCSLYALVLTTAGYLHPEFQFGADIPLNWPFFVSLIVLGGSALVLLGRNFQFGYILSFYFFLMIFGFLWINQATRLEYDRVSAGMAAAASALAFGLPALLIGRPVVNAIRLPRSAVPIILAIIVGLCGIIIIPFGLYYSTRVFDIQNYEQLRNELLTTAKLRTSIESPVSLRYAVGITSSALLPFAFACAIEQRRYWFSALILVLLACYFPSTLTKTALFAPLWLLFVALLATVFDARIAAILTLFIPMAAGFSALLVPGELSRDVFYFLDVRLMVVPSAALSFYNDFFAHHPKTFFCQVGLLRSVLECPYREQLGVELSKAYGLGNYNASLFATEGIASVGTLLSPLSAFACGLIIGGANRLSAGLPARFILVSSAVVSIALVNVPFSTALVTHGAGLLFVLWYLIPRESLVPTGVDK